MLDRIIAQYQLSPRDWRSVIRDSRIDGSPSSSPEVQRTFKAYNLVFAEAASSLKISWKLLMAISFSPFLWYYLALINFSIASSCFQFYLVCSSFCIRERAAMIALLSCKLASSSSELGWILSLLLISSLNRQISLVLTSAKVSDDAISNLCYSSWKGMVPSPDFMQTSLIDWANCSGSLQFPAVCILATSIVGKIFLRCGVSLTFLLFIEVNMATEGPEYSNPFKKPARYSSSLLMIGSGYLQKLQAVMLEQA